MSNAIRIHRHALSGHAHRVEAGSGQPTEVYGSPSFSWLAGPGGHPSLEGRKVFADPAVFWRRYTVARRKVAPVGAGQVLESYPGDPMDTYGSLQNSARTNANLQVTP